MKSRVRQDVLHRMAMDRKIGIPTVVTVITFEIAADGTRKRVAKWQAPASDYLVGVCYLNTLNRVRRLCEGSAFVPIRYDRIN